MNGTCDPIKKGEQLSKGFAAGGTNVRKNPSPASDKEQSKKKK